MNFYRFSWVYLEGDVTWRWARVFGNHFRGQERDVELGMMCGRYWFGSVLSIRGMFGEIEVSIFMSEIFDSSKLWGFLFCFWALCTHELTLSSFNFLSGYCSVTLQVSSPTHFLYTLPVVFKPHPVLYLFPHQPTPPWSSKAKTGDRIENHFYLFLFFVVSSNLGFLG
jgi:hypothetical protein